MILPNLSTKMIFRKTTALLAALSFAFSNVVFADITKNTAPSETSKQIEIVSDPAKIVVPRDYGLVKSIFTGKDKRLIIHIQDAHCNFEAQSNITKILENLIKNYGLTLVSVEGADGFIDTSWFKAFPDEEVRKEVAAYFMKKGEITGPEFLSITTDYPIKLFGAETRSYYIENLNAFTSSYPLKEDTEKYFNQIKAVLNKLKNYVYSDELKTLDAKIQDYESKKLQFTDYVKFLQGLAAGHNINLRQYENLFKLISVLIYEKKIDFNVVDKERSIIIDELTKKLTKEALTELVNNSLSFKTGRISSADYYDYLKKLAANHGFELSKDYPNLFNYIIYNSVYSRIENEKLFKDMKNLETAVKEKLFTNDDQRVLERLYRHIEILLGLVNIKLLNGDFDYYKSRKEEFTHEIFADFIKKMAARYGFAFELDSPSGAIKENMPKLEDFYAIAVKRDKALVDNTLQAMKKEAVQAAVLVTGGFHSEGITKMLENDGISYMVVCPNITKDVETPYIKILMNQRAPLEEILADTGAAAEPKSAKQGLLAPYLISAALLNIEELITIEGLKQRAEDVRKGWAAKHIRLWLPDALVRAAKMKIEITPQLAAAFFNISVDEAVGSYIENNHPDKSKISALREAAEKIKILAKDVITELLAGKATNQAPPAAGNLIGKIKTSDGCVVDVVFAELSFLEDMLTIKDAQQKTLASLSVIGKVDSNILRKTIAAIKKFASDPMGSLSIEEKAAIDGVIYFLEQKKSEGKIYILKENAEHIFGFSDGEEVYISESMVDNPIALFHEGAEGYYASNEDARKRLIAKGLTAHTYLRGLGHKDRSIPGAVIGLQDKLFGDDANNSFSRLIALSGSVTDLIERGMSSYGAITGTKNQEKGCRLSLERLGSIQAIRSIITDSIVSEEEKPLIAKMVAFGKGGVFKFWAELNDTQKRAIIEQIKSLDIEKAQNLYQKFIVRKEEGASIEVTRENLTSPPVFDIRELNSPDNQKALRKGEAAFRAGEVAILELAGGSGARLGHFNPKIMLGVSQIQDKSLGQMRAERIRTLAEEYGKPIPWIIMTSDVTHEKTVQFFNQHVVDGKYFGQVPVEWVKFVRQRIMPVITDRGEFILGGTREECASDEEAKDAAMYHIAVGGFGHGDARDWVLRNEEVTQWLQKMGVKYVMTTNVDNAFLPGPRAIGYHVITGIGAKPGVEHVSKLVVEKTDPREKVGMPVLLNGKDAMLEYNQVPEELAYIRYVYTMGHNQFILFKDDDGSIKMASLESFIAMIDRKGMRSSKETEEWVTKHCLSIDQISSDAQIPFFGKKWTKAILKEHAKLWLGTGNINTMVFDLSLFLNKDRPLNSLPEMVARGKKIDGYQPETGEYNPKEGSKVSVNKFEIMAFHGFLVNDAKGGAHIIVDRAGKGGEGGFAPIKEKIDQGPDNRETAARLLSSYDAYLLQERDWYVSPAATVELSPSFAFTDGRYLSSKVGSGGVVGTGSQLYISGTDVIIDKNFGLANEAQFYIIVNNEYNPNTRIRVGKNVEVKHNVCFTVNGGELIIDDDVIFDKELSLTINDGETCHITKSYGEGGFKYLLSSQKPTDIITQGKGEGRENMGKVDIAVGLDRAVNGDENAYKTIVRMPIGKLIAYLDAFVKDGLDKLPEGLFGLGKGYDVRGNALPITGGIVDLEPLNVYIIGKLLGTYYAKPSDKMLVTGDIRIHTPILKFMLALGASSVGVNAEYAPDFLTTGAHNLLSTDNEGNYKIMAQISGSHGVPQKNGLKIKAFLGKKDANGRMILEPLYAERLEGLYWKDKAKGVRQTDLRKEAKMGLVKEIAGLAKDVVNTLDKTLPPTEKDEIVVIDPRAGAAGPIILELLKKHGFFVIDMDNVDKKELMTKIRAIWNAPGRENGKFRTAVMLNTRPDGNMGRGIWDPSKPEALKGAIELVNLINSNLLKGMPKAFGAVFDGDADRITAILEDGTGVPAFEMTLPYYQRFLLDESNQEVMVRLAKAGFGPVKVVCDVRANSKLLALIDKVNGDLRKRADIYDKNIVEGWFITTGYPPQLGFMNNRIAQLDKFVNSNPGLNNDADFMKKFAHLKRTYFTAEASGHNFFHGSERYPDRVLDDAIIGFFTLMNIRETLTPAEVPVVKQDLLLTDLFTNFPHAYSSNEIRIPVPNAVKMAVATEIGAWMKEQYARDLKPFTPPVEEDDYLIQPKDDGYVTVSGFKVQLKDGRTALVRWSNTGEELTTIFEGRDLASLISITSEITERLRREVKRGVNVLNLDKEIARLKELQKYERLAQEKQAAVVIGQKLHTPLSSTAPIMAARFLQGGYNQSGYGIPVGAAVDGSFATGREGSQGYYVDITNRLSQSGHDLFVFDVAKMRYFFAARAREGKPIRYVIKLGIGGQHTPFQGIASGIQVIDTSTLLSINPEHGRRVDMEKGIIVGEYELGKDYEFEINKILKTLGRDVGWDQIVVIPSSKSGSTDETMMIFTEIFYAMLKNMAAKTGIKADAENFAQTVLEAMHKINFPGGKELKGSEIFKNMTFTFVTSELNAKGIKLREEEVRRIFTMTLRNMIFETTDKPESSRLAAFLASPLVQSLEENDKPIVIPMFDNVGGRWTADLHMMLFLAYNNLNADEYWQIRYKGIKETRSETHAGYKLGEKIVDEGITDIALVLPEELFWLGKSIEQNFNESIWQKGFANLIAIKENNWEYQEKHYAGNLSKLVINLSSLDIPKDTFNLVNLGPVNLKKLPNNQARVNKLGELFTTFYGMTHTVGNRLIARALAAKGYKAANIDLNDLDNPATKIVQQNLYLRQPYVELGKGLLEEKLKALQAKGAEAVEAEFEKNISLAAQKRLESNVPSIPSRNVSNMKELADCLYEAVKYAESTNRKFAPFIYLEGEKFYGLREHLVKLGIEWVLQGTGDQHINYQQVLAQPQKYLPFIVSFLPKDTETAVLGRPAIGFAKGYLNNVSPHMVRDLFAEMSYRALTEPRKNEAGEEVNGAAGIFLRMIDIETDRAMLTQSFDKAMAPTEDAVPEVAVSASFDHTPEAIWQSSAIGESVRHMAVEKFKYNGKMHLIFVKRAIPQIQLSTTTAVNLANICEEYYNAMEGYTAHIVDSYDKAVELLAKNSDWNKTNTIVGLVDKDDLEAMGSNLTANNMKDKTKLLAMEKFSDDQFVPIKGFFDLMSVMVRINKPLDTTNDSELIDGLRKLLNKIGVRDVNSLVDALSAGAYFEDPIKFAKNFILRLLPPAKPRDTKELKALYDAAKKVVESL